MPAMHLRLLVEPATEINFGPETILGVWSSGSSKVGVGSSPP
jgi:hypothetical protein